MGFDNECIVNIQSLAGEYFCPVCRLLVYPNEAIQSQCTHLYCKPCLAYVVGTTRACPYDGYLVTEADSKPLIESNKALAETIGNIAVHCLYHRSGCTWQGPLSECTSHCSGCAFGNSPVVCNRCGVQIVHRQVQEHAQTCPGVQPQTQQALGAPDTSAAGTATAADPSQTAVQSGTQSSQGQTTQATAAPPPGQDPNQQSSGNPQAQTVAPAAAPTPEQWYQQQYQQYYQQYPGYDPYQQTYQHSYPYQQQAQHVQGQHQPQVYTQPQAQPPLQPQAQAQPQPQPHAPPQPHQNIQVPVAAQHQNQAQGNLQQQVHPPIQMQSQTHAPPHGHPHPQPHPQSYPQGQPLPHLVQMPQYQQPPPQMQHPQPPIQPQHHSLPQPPAHSLAQPQAHVQHQPHSHPQINPPLQPNQPPNTNAHPQTQQPSAHAVTVTGHQSYPQPQAVQQMQLGAPQHPMQMHPHGGPPPQHPTQMHSQFPQQPPQMRPPQSHTPIHNQQHSALLPLQGQSGQQMLHPHSQQPGQPVQQRPVMQPIQQPVPQQLMQQQPFPGQTSGPVQNQLHQQAHLTPPPPPPMQSHLRPPPHSYMQSQQNVIHAPQPQQSQNFVGRPMMSNHGAQSQPFPQPTSGFTGPAQVRPMQFGANPQSANLNPLPRTNNQPLMSSEQQNFQSGMALKPPMFERQGDHMSKSVAEREAGLPSHITAKTEANGLVPTGVGADSVEARTLKSEADLKFSDSDQKPRGGDKDGTQHVDTHTLAKDTDFKLHAVENGSGEPAIKSMVKKEGIEGSVEPSFGGTETVVKEQRDSTDVPKPVDQSDSLEEHSDKLPKDVVENSLPVSTGADKGSHDIPLAPARVLDSSVHDVAPQGNSQTPTGRDPLQQGFQERNTFQSQIAPQGPGVDEPRGFPPQGHGFPHQQPTMHYGPPTHQQRPAAPPPRPLHQGYGPGQPPSMLRPQVPGEFSHTGPPLNPTDHFQTPMKQPYGSFPPEVPSGGNSGPGSTSSFGRGPTHFGPPQGSFELESSGPLGHYNHGRGPPPHVGGGPPPGSFDPHGGIMGRAPPHGPEGQFVQQRPNSQMEAEIFPDQRSRNFDGRRIDNHLPGTWEKGPLGQPPGIESNAMRMKLAPGIDSSSTLGYGDERFKPPPEEQFNPFPLEPARRLERGSRPHDKAPFGDNFDTGSGGAPSRFLPSYHSPGTFHPNEAGERVRPFGSDDNFGRADTSRTHPDFLKPAAGFGRHHMDRSTPRSPGREYPSIPPRGFGGVPRRQSGVDDIDGGQSRPFGEGFHGSRFPLSPGHLRRGEHDGPGILRGGDFTEQDILPSHLRRGEMLSHQNLPGHLRFGDPSGFGGFPAGPGNLPHGFPPGESFGGKKSSHPRLGEPGFRSSYSLQGFPNDGGFFTSSMDSIDNSRKRKPTSMGWCRICRVDCETVEGLDMHSQTREHQKKAMDMVLSIKQQNAKRQKKPNDRSSREEASKSRSAVYEGRGNKA